LTWLPDFAGFFSPFPTFTFPWKSRERFHFKTLWPFGRLLLALLFVPAGLSKIAALPASPWVHRSPSRPAAARGGRRHCHPVEVGLGGWLLVGFGTRWPRWPWPSSHW
jgi:hypothetical protein